AGRIARSSRAAARAAGASPSSASWNFLLSSPSAAPNASPTPLRASISAASPATALDATIGSAAVSPITGSKFAASGISPAAASEIPAASAGRRAAATDLPSSLSPPLARSEEHTSELQSRENLVCRLLLEKKKYTLVKQY